ncbi:hypothetical protein VTN77DRAFT_3258 [Rasamsonia byssochlamydoides]|uniref:uncharacterized protein n=1 Tax=Rasamsonia byssochlamydoides TaxID=89139 RepID=UPI003743396D
MVPIHCPVGTSAPLLAVRLVILSLCVLLVCINGVVADNITQPISIFKSRPDLYSPILTLELRDPARLSPGYILVTPYETDNPGPYIYDNEGNLVWTGWGQSGPGNAHALHVCDYKGSPHLCFFQGNQQLGYCRGHGIIMDNRYRIVRSVQAGGGMAASDMHEFRLLNGGKTALMTIYQQRQFDMSRWNIRTGMAWIMESIFQEVDVETSEVLFEWRSLDHVDPTVSYTHPASTDTSGDGLSPHSPWDYFHINSVDKNADGDYLISSRHTCAIYKISGKDGSVIWRLGGANPSFRNINFSFSQQHDARWLSENQTHTVLSLFNNGFNGFNKTHDYSSGMMIVIDHVDKTATQIREYAPPGRMMLSSSQGNLQVLPNNNAFIGWGNNAFISEYDGNGELVLWGYLALQGTMNYRAQKFYWDGNPTDSPALWAYSRGLTADSPTMLYASWNGATRVKSWRFYGSMQQQGPFEVLAVVDKRGFETEYAHGNFSAWCYVEALDGDGKVLGRSTTRMTFVPSPELSSYCADTFCENAPAYGYPGEDNPSPTIPPPIHYEPVSYPYEGQADGADGQGTTPLLTVGNTGYFPGSESGGTNYYNRPAGSRSSSWLVPAAWVIGVGVIVVVIALRCRSRRHDSDTVKDHDSNDGENENFLPTPKPEESSAGLREMPWWHWRRWIRAPPPQKYYPLDSMGERGESSS